MIKEISKHVGVLRLLFNFALTYAIRRVQVSQDALKLMVHTGFWFMLIMSVYWEEAYVL
jgi:hypothetical protein